MEKKKKKSEPKRPITSSLCLGNRRVQADQYMKTVYREDAESLFTKVCSDRTTGNDFKLKADRFTLDTRKNFLQ